MLGYKFTIKKTKTMFWIHSEKILVVYTVRNQLLQLFLISLSIRNRLDRKISFDCKIGRSYVCNKKS